MTGIDAYLQRLSEELHRRFITDALIIDEVRGHLTDAVEAARSRGVDDAEYCAIELFGAPEVVGAAFAADRTRALHRILLIGACVAGLAVAYVDSRPTWDDAGVTAGTMFLLATVLGLLGPQRPWLWGLMVGLGVPGYALVRNPAGSALTLFAALMFPFAGAYLGRGIRLIARRAPQVERS